MFGLVAVGVVVVVVVLLLIGGGHGPQRHLSAGDAFHSSRMQLASRG